MSDLINLKQFISNTFKMSGFVIRSETSLFLAEQLVSLTSKEQEEWLERITTHVQNQGLKTAKVEITHLELAIKECDRRGLDDLETIFSVISAYDVPKFKFNFDRKKFDLENSSSSLLPNATKKSVFLTNRYTILYQRTIRHELFSPVIAGTTCTVKKFSLKLIENLLSSSKMNDIVILGYLTQFTEGKYHLEDPTGCVALDLSSTQFHSGLVCEGCFVLAEGNYYEDVLKVAGLGFPPAELANSSRAYFGTVNSWGGQSKTLLKYSPRLLEIEKSNTDATLVFLSDCLLDNPIVMDKLTSLFIGYNDSPPTAIVLMGPFISDVNNMILLKHKLNTLADILQQCPRLKQETDLILVPSLDDPTAEKILPRPPLPQSLCSEFLKKVPKTILATNPCRLQYCTQQIVVCRADLVTKFCRNTVHFPTTGLLEEHFARTLICQATLAPLTPIAMPTYWDHDCALSLYPLPDVIVIGDPSQAFDTIQQGCTIINSGSFIKSKFAFKVYVPSSRTVEDSQIPDEPIE